MEDEVQINKPRTGSETFLLLTHNLQYSGFVQLFVPEDRG